ncbi:MAG: hypothetical protein QOE87_1457 [Gaiellales bacterium]|nr:hypothetical protein [Gaiellales bacterium]
MPDPVHVVNGDSVEHALARSGLPGAVIVWRDVLHEGDVPPGVPATVREARAAFLAGAGYGNRERILAGLAEADEALIAALDDGRETVLWFEHDLHDQLQLSQILSRIAGHPGRAAVRLITLDSFPGRPGFAGLGELSPEELVTLWPLRAPLGPGAYILGARAYAALQESDGDALAALAEERSADVPYLGAALRRLLEERPWAGPGLGRSERQIVRAVAAGARTPADVFLATMCMEEAPYSGDSWTFKRIDDLASGDRPLLVSTACGLALTPAGQAALSRWRDPGPPGCAGRQAPERDSLRMLRSRRRRRTGP